MSVSILSDQENLCGSSSLAEAIVHGYVLVDYPVYYEGNKWLHPMQATTNLLSLPCLFHHQGLIPQKLIFLIINFFHSGVTYRDEKIIRWLSLLVVCIEHNIYAYTQRYAYTYVCSCIHVTHTRACKSPVWRLELREQSQY